MEFCVPKRQCTTYLRCSRRMECNSYERMIYKHLKKFTGLHTGRLHGNLFSVSKSVQALFVADCK